MGARVQLAKSTIREAMTNRQVRAKLKEVADVIGPEVRRLALEAADQLLAESVRIEQGTRPGTKSPEGFARPYARVLIADPRASSYEYGDEGVDKAAIIRRAIRGY